MVHGGCFLEEDSVVSFFSNIVNGALFQSLHLMIPKPPSSFGTQISPLATLALFLSSLTPAQKKSLSLPPISL